MRAATLAAALLAGCASQPPALYHSLTSEHPVSLTPDGEQFLPACAAVLNELLSVSSRKPPAASVTILEQRA